MILGFQRSGTTILGQCLDRDWRVQNYGEYALSVPGGDAPRLRPLDEVARALADGGAPIAVIKPLVESQHALKMLEIFPNCRALWLYRDVRPVALSNVKKFPDYNAAKLLNLLSSARDTHWVNEGLSAEVQDTLRTYDPTSLSQFERIALVWYARNQLFFDLGLDQRPEVVLVRYEELIRYPEVQMRRIYGHLGKSFPGQGVYSLLHGDSLAKGAEVGLRPGIDQLCRGLAGRLDSLLEAQSRH